MLKRLFIITMALYHLKKWKVSHSNFYYSHIWHVPETLLSWILSLTFPSTPQRYYPGSDGITSVALSIHTRYPNTAFQWWKWLQCHLTCVCRWGVPVYDFKVQHLLAQTGGQIQHSSQQSKGVFTHRNNPRFAFLVPAEFDPIILCTARSRNFPFRATLSSPTPVMGPDSEPSSHLSRESGHTLATGPCLTLYSGSLTSLLASPLHLYFIFRTNVSWSLLWISLNSPN